MTRSQRIYLAALLTSLGTGHALAQSAPPPDGSPLDARAVRPAVMLLVDTSGSMERVPDDGSNPDCDNCVPTCTGDSTQDSASKTRWAMTIEALTGSIQNYACVAEDRTGDGYVPSDYDYGYYLPHINFTDNLSQASDGILDSFASRVKFGLMTFDGVGTTIGGATLVPYSYWFTRPDFMTRAYAAPGMYSYGRVGRLSFPGCTDDYGVNAGARGPGNHPGAMVRVGDSDDADAILDVNNQIQTSLLTVRPFGGTPIPAMLDDLKYYLDGSDTDSDLSPTGDPLYNCRTRTAILITDGAPDALFRDSRFQCEPTDPSHLPCAPNSAPDAGTPTGDAGAGSANCECPYLPAPDLAAQLVNSDGAKPLLDRLIVVAYNVFDTNALATLEAIAAAGSKADVPGATPEYPHLIQANGPTELRDKLDDLLSVTMPGVTSRSVPISVNTGDQVLGEDSKRYDITAGFHMGRDADDPWSGLLYRQRVLCGGTDGMEIVEEDLDPSVPGDVIHQQLNQRTTARDLFTVKPSIVNRAIGTLVNPAYTPAIVQGTDTSFDISGPNVTAEVDTQTGLRDTDRVQNHMTPDNSTLPTVVPDATIVRDLNLFDDSDNINVRAAFDGNLAEAYFGDADSDGRPGQIPDRTLILDYVHGRSRPGNVMADIYHSNPVALFPVNQSSGSRLNSIDTAYSSWLRALAGTGDNAHYGAGGRPGMIFVGTNDGVLHAFNLEDWSESGGRQHKAGDELWGFIPPALFGKMHSMLAGHQYMFDGTPIVQDVMLQKRGGEAPIFRTVLVAAVRGAPAFVALDVTFPEEPVFLWQSAFGALGNTIANPGLTQVDVDWGGEKQTRAVAILPGGEGVPNPSCSGGQTLDDGVTRAQFPEGNMRNVRCWNQRGRSLYVVDVASGHVIQEFGPEHFPSPLSGSISVDGVGTSRSTAAYFFDHDGILWRLSMLHSDASQWTVQPIYDMFADPFNVTGTSLPRPDWAAGRRPVYAPTLTLNRQGNLVILAGTGNIDEPIDSAHQRVVSLTEYRDADLGNTEITGTVLLNWKIDLVANESVTGPLTVVNDVVYFSSFESFAGNDQCSLGKSRIYGVHTYERQPGTGDPASWAPVPKPELVATNALPTAPRVQFEEFDQGGTNLLLGLTARRQPICQSTGTPYLNPITNQSMPAVPPSGGLYQLSGVLAGGSTGGRTKAGSQIGELPLQQPLQDRRNHTVSTWASFAD